MEYADGGNIKFKKGDLNKIIKTHLSEKKPIDEIKV
jgi:hypothetical protein